MPPKGTATGKKGWIDGGLVVLAICIAMLDNLLYALAIGFSPGFGGFGGDARSAHDLAMVHVTNRAAFVGCFLGLIAPLSVLVTSGALRTRALLVMVGVQVVATIALFCANT